MSNLYLLSKTVTLVAHDTLKMQALDDLVLLIYQRNHIWYITKITINNI